MAQVDARLVWIKILFPLFVMAGLGILPVEKQVFDLSQAARVAERDEQHGVAARLIYALEGQQPWRAELWERAGKHQLAAEDYSAAIRDLQHAAALDDLSPDGQVMLANAYEKNGQFGEAARLWAQAAQARPSGELFAHLVNAQRQAGSMDLAIAALRQWQQLEPFNPQVAYTLGLFLAAQSPAEALAQLNEAARLEPAYTAGLEELQRAFALADLNADEAYRYTVIGRGLASLGEWDLAERALQSATQANPDYAEAWALLGEARLQLGQDGAAELDKALQINPNSVLVRALMALYLGREGKWAQAIGHLEVAAQLEPDRAVWRIELGNLNAENGDLIAAQIDYQAAVELEANNMQTWYALAAFCYRYGVDLEQTGLPAARQALALSAEDAQANDLLGAILVELGEETEGEEYLLKAVELAPELAEAHLHLGNLYLQRQEMAKAYQQILLAARADPAGPTGALAQRLLARYFGETVESTSQP